MADPKQEEFKVFVTHVLKGARFDDHSVPVTILPELALYRDLVLEVARTLFFRDNPERKRVPKGFDESLDLVLRDIGDGSAVAALQRRRKVAASGPAQLTLLGAAEGGDTDHFEQARDLVGELIDAVRSGRPTPKDFPVAAVRLFNGFGRSLRDEESIEIQGTDARRVTYDRKTRKKLVLLRDKTYEDAVDVVGKVVQFDLQRGTFGVLHGERVVPGLLEGLDEEQLRIVRTAAVHTEALQVRAVGTGAYDSADQLVRLVAVKDLGFAEDEDLRAELDVDKRLAGLAELEAGWLDGAGSTVDEMGLSWLATVLKNAEANGLVRPYLYPTPGGQVQAEWSFPGVEVSALFDLAGRAVSCVGAHTKSGAHLEEDVSLDDAAGLSKLVAFVGRFAP